MPDLKLEKKKLELLRIKTGQAEIEYKIMERLDDVERMKKNLEIQKQRIKELEQELGE